MARVRMAIKRPPAFRRRISEREPLNGRLDNVRRGRSKVVVMRGRAGIGKTALLRWLAGEAAGFRVGQIADVEYKTELPFAGLHQPYVPTLSHLDALPEPQLRALRVVFTKLGIASRRGLHDAFPDRGREAART